MLRGLDALVFDIQDVGVRFYTYESTMLYAMEEAAKAKIPFYVLDRPNPLTGIHVEGPMLDAGQAVVRRRLSAAAAPRHDDRRTGEAGKRGERHLNADLHVIEMAGWNRDDWFDATGLPWVNPSPNIRNLNEALLYPGAGNAGIFDELFGWPGHRCAVRTDRRGLDSRRANSPGYLSALEIPGVRFYPVAIHADFFEFQREERFRESAFVRHQPRCLFCLAARAGTGRGSGRSSIRERSYWK